MPVSWAIQGMANVSLGATKATETFCRGRPVAAAAGAAGAAPWAAVGSAPRPAGWQADARSTIPQTTSASVRGAMGLPPPRPSSRTGTDGPEGAVSACYAPFIRSVKRPHGRPAAEGG